MARVNIWPRKPSDKGGTLCMPRVDSFLSKGEEPTKKDWKITTCPVCGDECYTSPDIQKMLKADPTLHAACTRCALSFGLKPSN